MTLGCIDNSCSNCPVGIGGRGLLALTLAVGLAGCISTTVMKYPGVEVASRRLAAFPSEGIVWSWDFYGKRTADEKGGIETRKNLDDSINYRLRRHGGRSFDAASIDGLEHARAFRSWAVDTLTALIAQRFSDAEKPHLDVGDFRFPESLESWREPLDADFVLVTFFLDGHDTQGRAIAVAIAGGYRAARRAISCAVHLQSGRVVWCNFDVAMKGDLKQRWGAQQEVDLLLGEMLSEGETVASEPPPPRSTATRLTPAADVTPAVPPRPPVASVDRPVFHAAPQPADAAPR